MAPLELVVAARPLQEFRGAVLPACLTAEVDGRLQMAQVAPRVLNMTRFSSMVQDWQTASAAKWSKTGGRPWRQSGAKLADGLGGKVGQNWRTALAAKWRWFQPPNTGEAAELSHQQGKGTLS